MAVLERTYKPYAGASSPEWSRFLIIPRHAYRDIFRSKIFTGFFVVSFVWPLVCAVLIYLRYNTTALAILQIQLRDLLAIDASFFESWLVVPQCMVAFFLAMLVGPQQVSRDLANNALPLYLCRPFSRIEYVVGKMSIVIILLSAMTWVPTLLLFLFQSYLEGWTWFSENVGIASAIFLGCLVWILLLALLTQAISAWVKWVVAARAALLGVFFIPSAFAGIVNQIFETHWGNIFSLSALMQNVWAGLFGTFEQQTARTQELRGGVIIRQALISEPPLWVNWFALFLICAFCLWLLSRKVKAYEVVT
jgi:ABC-2 type transport system permease protein